MQRPLSPWQIGPGESLSLAHRPTRAVDDDVGKKALRRQLRAVVEELAQLQRLLYADDRYALLLVFQAMDAAGKDSTIRTVFSGVNPAGFQVHAFKRPSAAELDHDFLWRSARALPQRGRIGVFNRSYYEEVLVVRVHPSILDAQQLPDERPRGEALWDERLQSIREHEAHLVRNGTRVLKFFLHVSPEEQARRLLDRLDKPHKNWKFDPGDLRERRHWADYRRAYEAALSATSTAQAPWFVIPADDKPRLRLEVAKTVRAQLRALPLRWPEMAADQRGQIDYYRAQLRGEPGRSAGDPSQPTC